MSKPPPIQARQAQARQRSLMLIVGLSFLILGSLCVGGCDYVGTLGEDKQSQTLFPELTPGSYFGEIVLAGKRVGLVERLPLLVVVRQAGRLSWGVGDYSVREMKNSYSGVANLLLPFTLDLQEGLVELTWERPECGSKQACSAMTESISKWHGDVLSRGASGKKKSIAVSKVNGGRIGAWYLRKLVDTPDRLLSAGGSQGKNQGLKSTEAVLEHGTEEFGPHRVEARATPGPNLAPAVHQFDLDGTVAESGFCALSEADLSNVMEELQSDRKDLARQLYYTVRATPAGRLVWLSRLLLSQESSKIRPVAALAVAPVIDNEIELEKKRLAALQALGN